MSAIGSILIEVMLAAMIGLLLISFLFEIYITSQQSFRLQSALNQIQNSAKMTVDILSSEIHQAGYIGCARLTDDFPITPFQHYSITPQNKLTGTDNAITVRHASPTHVELIYPMQDLSILETNATIHFKKNSVLIISDCKHAEIFRVKNISYLHGIQKIKPEIPLHSSFDNHAEISLFEINHFYSENSTLCLENIHRSKLRLVSGIEALRIHYMPSVSKISAVGIDIEVATQSLHKTWHAYVSI